MTFVSAKLVQGGANPKGVQWLQLLLAPKMAQTKTNADFAIAKLTQYPLRQQGKIIGDSAIFAKSHLAVL